MPGPSDEAKRNEFRGWLREAKRRGIEAITADVWWGLVQPGTPDQFDWTYYDWLFGAIAEEGLAIVPILSTHQCGTNVGDTVFVPLPRFIQEKMRGGGGIPDLRYLSEVGQYSEEVVSAWGTPYVIDDYARFFAAFAAHFGPHFGHRIEYLTASVGPASELTFPAYHYHDRAIGYPPALYPRRGSMQMGSELAQAGFRAWLERKYSTIEALDAAWGFPGKHQAWQQIDVFTNRVDSDRFFEWNDQFSRRGTDAFTYYHEVLTGHAVTVLGRMAEVFGRNPDFRGKPISFKIPGIHWSFHSKLPQLTAGLLTTAGADEAWHPPLPNRRPASWSAENGHGYQSLFAKTVGELRRTHPGTRWIVEFTCGEMPSCAQGCHGHGACGCGHPQISGAEELVRAIHLVAREFNVPVVLENALAENLYDPTALERLRRHIVDLRHFAGVSLLRLQDVVKSEHVERFLRSLGAPSGEGNLSCSRRIAMLKSPWF